jgi:adenylate cyclase
MSILFADIVGFTSRSERTPPEELVALLNTYMTAMIDVILRSGGVVDKLMGDGIMAFWGAPGDLPNPARTSIECALDMLGELDRLRRTDPRFVDVDIGIGIATGDAIVGNFGGQQRFDYSAIGDTVNLASRIEGLTRHFKVHLLVNHQTLEEAADGFIMRNIGAVRVKGKQQAVEIVEVAGRSGGAVEPAFYQQFGAALAALQKGSQDQARTELEELAKKKPDDHVVQIYLERLQASNGNGSLMDRLNPFRRKSVGPVDGSQYTLFELDTK